MLKFVVIAVATLAMSNQLYAQQNEKLIPQSNPDGCKYYLAKSERTGALLKVTHKQVCQKNEYYSGVSYTVMKVDCKRRKFAEVGYGDDSIQNIQPVSPIEWSGVIAGSSRSDLVNYVCK